MQQRLLFTELLVHSLHRATFALGLCWRDPDQPFQVSREDGKECIHDSFRFDEAGEWLRFEAEASAAEAEVPQVRIRVGVTARHLSEAEALAIANQVNRRGLAPVYFDAEAGELVVQHGMVFTGYHDTPSVEVDPAFTLCQREATLNMLVAAFATVHACVQAVWPDRVAPQKELQRVDTASPDVLEAFSVFVISRMYRWGVVSLREGSAALDLLREAAARCFVADQTSVLLAEGLPPPGEGAEAAARERIADWMRRRLWLDRADDAYLDALLFDVDRAARSQLRDAMSDPPNARPLRQLPMLETALAKRGETWDGVQVTEANLRAALAVGLDVEVAGVPAAFAERLRQQHRFLSPPANASSIVLPQEHWLTNPPASS